MIGLPQTPLKNPNKCDKGHFRQIFVDRRFQSRYNLSGMRSEENQQNSDSQKNPSAGELRFTSFKGDKTKFNRPIANNKPQHNIHLPVYSDNHAEAQFSEINSGPRQNLVPVMETTYSSIDEDSEKIDVRDYIGVVLHRRYWLVASLIIVVLVGFFTKWNHNPSFKSTSRLRVISMTGVMDPFYGYDYISDNTISTHKENIKSFKFLKNVTAKLDTNLSERQIANMIKVDRTRDANIINIVVTSEDALFSSYLANVIASEYENYDLIIKQKAFYDYESWIRSQMSQKQEILDSLEGAIKNFFQDNPIFYTKKGEGNNLSIKNYDAEITETNLQIQEINKAQFLREQELKETKSEIVEDVDYSSELRNQMMSLKLELATLSSKYRDEHPKILELKDKMLAVKDLIRKSGNENAGSTKLSPNPKWQRLTNEKEKDNVQRELLLSKKQNLIKLQEEAIKNLAMAPELEQKLNQLTRNKATTEKMYLTLQEKLQDTQLKKSATPREIFQMDNAAPKGALVPHNYINFGTSILIGLIVGIGVCFLIDYLDTTVQKSKDVENKYGIKLLGLIPKEDIDGDRLLITGSDENALIKPHFEPYRRLLENIFPTGQGQSKSIVVTSALQGEGKTTTAANLATTAALKGERVLIIDADLRRHNVHNIFNIENEYGLSEFLSGGMGYSQIIRNSGIKNLDIICAGKNPLSLTQAQSRLQIQGLLKMAYRDYELVIIDSPPILQLVDTLTLAPLVTRTLVVFRSKKTPLKAGEEVLRQLNHIGAKVVGGVLNDVSKSFWDQYYYQYYKYGYSYYYK